MGIVLQIITQTDLQLGEYGQAITHAPTARGGGVVGPSLQQAYS